MQTTQTFAHRDVAAYSKASSVMEPLAIYHGHSAVVEVCRYLSTNRRMLMAACRIGRRLASETEQRLCFSGR